MHHIFKFTTLCAYEGSVVPQATCSGVAVHPTSSYCAAHHHPTSSCMLDLDWTNRLFNQYFYTFIYTLDSLGCSLRFTKVTYHLNQC